MFAPLTAAGFGLAIFSLARTFLRSVETKGSRSQGNRNGPMPRVPCFVAKPVRSRCDQLKCRPAHADQVLGAKADATACAATRLEKRGHLAN